MSYEVREVIEEWRAEWLDRCDDAANKSEINMICDRATRTEQLERENATLRAELEQRLEYALKLNDVVNNSWRERDAAESALSTVRAELERVKRDAMGCWQPIETAPKGVKVIAGYPNRLGNWRTITACYYLPETLESEEDTESGYADEGWYEESESQEQIMPTACAPTHWMPLPEPPAIDEQITSPAVPVEQQRGEG